ncbi:ATPase AAA [Polymorphobacter glacialis]|uniref:ATPase AAA n=1 Tax=Sandarakinorhabdus glacialis TaxID=1614636 RepID=A0A917E649_9SPHN|nr:AAA family ATPase [Polymorphobacter glacialis]GGE08548.1 ATPase AAA [Polymorphobacter glacialis]
MTARLPGRRTTFDAPHFLLRVLFPLESRHDTSRYPLSIAAARDIEAIEFHPKVTFLVGENGSGKSTLIEAIAVLMGLNPEGGTQNFAFSTRASHSSLAGMLRPVRGVKRPKTRFFLRAESFFNLATNIEDLDTPPDSFGPPIGPNYSDKSLHEQSHGESFMALMLNRFGPQGLYILDEPEAALSPQRQLAMLVRMHDLVGQGCQFIIATHSPILMAYPDATIYQLDDRGILPTTLRDTDHYRVTLDFLRDPEKRIADLLGD